jgi:hypothetical protein
MYTYVYISIYTYSVCIRKYTYVYLRMYVYICMYTLVCIHMYTLVYIHIQYVYVSMYTYVYISIYTYVNIRNQPTYGKNVIVRRTTGGHMPDSFFSTQHFFQTWNEGFEGCPDIVVKQCAVQTTLFAE